MIDFFIKITLTMFAILTYESALRKMRESRELETYWYRWCVMRILLIICIGLMGYI